MVDNNKIKTTLQRLSETLMFHSSFLHDIGLFNGKMGIAIFFFHLARKTGIGIYEEYACELIEQIYESMYENMPVGYADGVAGIGVGMDYLIEQKLITADADEVLEDIDRVILHHTQYHLPPMPEIKTGITGFGKYYVMRLFNRKHVNDDDPCKDQLLKIIQDLSGSYNSYEELLSVIQFLTGIMMIAHGGQNSITECVMNEVPMLIYQYFKHSDLGGNSARVVYHGIGNRGFIEKESVEQMEGKILEVLHNPVYRSNLHTMRLKFEEKNNSTEAIGIIENIVKAYKDGN